MADSISVTVLKAEKGYHTASHRLKRETQPPPRGGGG